jgi:DNA-binding CsgD family transcriptional regulator
MGVEGKIKSFDTYPAAITVNFRKKSKSVPAGRHEIWSRSRGRVMDVDIWRRIAHIWAHLAVVPVSKPDDAVNELWAKLSEMIAFDKGYIILAQKAGPEKQPLVPDYFQGWLIAQFFFAPGTSYPGYAPHFEEHQRERVHEDEWMQSFVNTCGKHRAFIREDVLGERPWSACTHSWMMERLEISDRMYAAFALDENLEVYLCLDRQGDKPFEPADRDITHEINKGLGPFWARLALSYGLYRHQQSLTRRQREMLLYLLDGYSEAEIAKLMGLTRGTAHQYVIKVFRALNVSSRAELMAMWMGDLVVMPPKD